MTASRQLGPEEPPLNADGDLELSPELELVADRLRREADGMARLARPQAAWRNLWTRLPAARRRTWFGPAAIAGCVALTVLGWQGARLADYWAARSPAADTRPAATAPAFASSSQLPPSPAVGPASPPSAASLSGPDDYSAFVGGSFPPASNLGPVSDAERIEMLEAALEAYRAALVAQQDRIRETEARLHAAEQELARWKAERER